MPGEVKLLPMIERVLSSIIGVTMIVALLPFALLYRIYDWLQDRKFERETNAKYGGPE